MIFPLISLTSLKGLIFDAEKLDEKDTHDLEYVRHDIRHSSFTVLEVEKLHFGV